jgi:hypothetical protein
MHKLNESIHIKNNSHQFKIEHRRQVASMLAQSMNETEIAENSGPKGPRAFRRAIKGVSIKKYAKTSKKFSNNGALSQEMIHSRTRAV